MVRKLKSENDQLLSTVKSQDERITQLTSQVNSLKLSMQPDEENERSFATSPTGAGPSRTKAAKHGSAMQYSFGRWTAHRADTRKVSSNPLNARKKLTVPELIASNAMTRIQTISCVSVREPGAALSPLAIHSECVQILVFC